MRIRNFLCIEGVLNCLSLLTSRVSGRGNIFGSVRVCVRPCVRLRSTGRTVGPTDLKFGTRIKDRHISDKFEGQGHRSKVKVTRVKNVKITVFSLVSEIWSKVKVTWVKVTKVKVIGQGHRVKVKVVWGVLYAIDSREVRHAGVFINF